MDEPLLLPTPKQISEFLQLHPTGEIEEAFQSSLLDPLQTVLGRSGKLFRTKLLDLAFAAEIGQAGKSPRPDLCQEGAALVESIHAASMIIDDIEDGSRERRGAPTLHLRVGIPVALNAGNWLYFWPLWKLRHWDLPPEAELRVQRLCTDAILKAHCGQAIDVGETLDIRFPSQVRRISLASLELKTGALVGLSTELGAVLGGASPERCAHWRTFGVKFGVALQMFDDLGNFTSISAGAKRYEDLRLKRPGWVWAMAAEGSVSEFEDFCACIEKLPDDRSLQEWASRVSLESRAHAGAWEYLQKSIRELESVIQLPNEAFVWQLAEKLRSAYA